MKLHHSRSGYLVFVAFCGLLAALLARDGRLFSAYGGYGVLIAGFIGGGIAFHFAIMRKPWAEVTRKGIFHTARGARRRDRTLRKRERFSVHRDRLYIVHADGTCTKTHVSKRSCRREDWEGLAAAHPDRMRGAAPAPASGRS
ncbi:hypothetical protein [Salininema proteolyticum]|uniref:Uncharacterized protein n=1 Tax=Salininema proteolyticum TaxID=1607685 RepID=A0ABV8TTA7_9ACTN